VQAYVIEIANIWVIISLTSLIGIGYNAYFPIAF